MASIETFNLRTAAIEQTIQMADESPQLGQRSITYSAGVLSCPVLSCAGLSRSRRRRRRPRARRRYLQMKVARAHKR